MKNTIFKKGPPGNIQARIIQTGIIAGLFIFFAALPAFAGPKNDVTQKYKKATQKLNKTDQTGLNIPVPGNIVKVLLPYQGGVFFTLARKNKIKRFQCTSCHDKGKVLIRNAQKISHADIKINHGGQDTPLACNTCHNKNDRDFLVTAKQDRIDMDHVYNMCGQCHFRQKKDWIGGAHGKRVTYWAGERVVKNCTSCHNPHSPRFAKRWPKTYSVPLK